MEKFNLPESENKDEFTAFSSKFHLDENNRCQLPKEYFPIEGKSDRESELKKEEVDSCLHDKFEDFTHLAPETVVRDLKDSTLFTTAGVQRIETMLSHDPENAEAKFFVPQPVIRSQFIDKVQEGTSTSFINYSFESLNKDDSIEDVFTTFIEFLINLGFNAEEISLRFKTAQEKWGKRKFTNKMIQFYYNGIGIADIGFTEDYPVTDEKNARIIDLGFGIERLMWALNQKNYHQGFEKYYNDIDPNLAASIIDPVKSMVLIAMHDVLPSKHNHGYRFRQLAKRFVERSRNINFNLENCIKDTYEYWEKPLTDVSTIEMQTVIDRITQECERNMNVLTLGDLKDKFSIDLNIEINISREEFVKRLSFSIDKDTLNKILI